MWFPNRSDTNRLVQVQKQARSLKFWIRVEEELYYPSSENKGPDQLRGYREADLRLCFCLCRLLVFQLLMLRLKALSHISENPLMQTCVIMLFCYFFAISGQNHYLSCSVHLKE